MARNLFVNQDSGAICRVVSTDDSYAQYEVIHPVPSSYNMPKREYDANFHKYWRPARAEDLNTFEAEFELPAEAPPEWVNEVLGNERTAFMADLERWMQDPEFKQEFEKRFTEVSSGLA